MVHVFSCLGRQFLLDVDTCSLFEIDEVTAALVPLVEAGEGISGLEGDYGKEELEQAYRELVELKNRGVAFTQRDFGAFQKEKPAAGLKAMCLHVSHDCELRCRYCFAGTGAFHGTRDLMSLETGKKALEFLVAHSGERSNLEVDFFGGEPLLNWEVAKQIMDYGRRVLEPKFDKTFRFTVTTNGYGLSDQIIEEMEQMYNVVVSIDGRQQVHDHMRPDFEGAPTYQRILGKGLRLKEARGDKSYYVRGTFTSRNLDFCEDVLHLADAGFDQISMEPVVLERKSRYAIREEHLPRIFEEYEKLAQAYIQRRKNPESWFNFFHFMIDMNGGPCISKRLTGCGAGNEYIAITPGGDIFPCHQFVGNKPFVMGNVFEGSFDREMQRVFAGNHVLNKPECETCWCKFFCSGGCVANSVNFNGELMKPYGISCQMQKKRTECALAIYAIEKFN